MSRLKPKVFEEGNDYQDIEDQDDDDKEESLLDSSCKQFVENNSNASNDDNLEDLIMKLNDEDHSEDQGIEDYKIGGYHPCHVGEILANRYVLVQKLGWGHFSTVWLAKDFKFQNYVAVKIMKSSPHYLQASYDEVEILQKVASYAYHPQWVKSLKEYQPHKQKFDRDDCHVLNLLNSFLYKGPYGNHFCMVFEILGVNLLEVLKRYDYKGLPLDLVKEISRQVLMGLDFLNRICRVIHTDLKPENVLLCLTEDEIRKIVEDGQLSSKQIYRDRLRLYRKKYKMGPEDSSEQQNQKEVSEIQSVYQEKIEELHVRLEQDKSLNKNQRKNLKKKIRKLAAKGKEDHPKSQKEKEKKEKKEKTVKELFSAFDTKLVLDKGPKLEKGFKVKIADLGNACWEHHHFATEIQTRQYRGPEVLSGSKYGLSADMWSFACMTFEMLTGELLFNPRKDKNETFGKNDDHLAQMMELLGRFPKKLALRGTKSRKYFSKQGSLRRIPRLQNWSLKDVMIAKYRFTEQQAKCFQDFMSPTLNCFPQKRTLAREMLKHPWLYEPAPSNYFMAQELYDKIKAERYDLQVVKEELHQYESENEDASGQDNTGGNEDNQDEFYGYEKVGNIRLIDRSFMDLGYIGYGDGIFLQKLDAGPNWQFQN